MPTGIADIKKEKNFSSRHRKHKVTDYSYFYELYKEKLQNYSAIKMRSVAQNYHR